MVYTKKEKAEIERVREVFAEYIQKSPYYDLLWSDKVGYVWLSIEIKTLYVDTGRRIKCAADFCELHLDDIADDVFVLTKNDHTLEDADPLEIAEIKRRWKTYIDQLPEYEYLCEKLLNVNR